MKLLCPVVLVVDLPRPIHNAVWQRHVEGRLLSHGAPNSSIKYSKVLLNNPNQYVYKCIHHV